MRKLHLKSLIILVISIRKTPLKLLMIIICLGVSKIILFELMKHIIEGASTKVKYINIATIYVVN